MADVFALISSNLRSFSLLKSLPTGPVGTPQNPPSFRLDYSIFLLIFQCVRAWRAANLVEHLDAPQRPITQPGLGLHVLHRHVAPAATVVAVVPVVAHHEQVALGNPLRRAVVPP